MRSATKQRSHHRWQGWSCWLGRYDGELTRAGRSRPALFTRLGDRCQLRRGWVRILGERSPFSNTECRENRTAPCPKTLHLAIKSVVDDQLASIRRGESTLASKLLPDGHSVVGVRFGSEDMSAPSTPMQRPLTESHAHTEQGDSAQAAAGIFWKI